MANKFKGRTISDVMNLDIDEFLSLTKTELRQAVSKLASAANKRVKRISKSDVVSPAFMEMKEEGIGKFGTRGKDYVELQVEFRRVTNFLRDKTSTIKGALELEKETREDLKSVYGIDITKEDFSDLLKGFSELLNESPEHQGRKLRYSKLQDIDIQLDNPHMTTKEISDSITEVLNRYYNVGGAQYDGVSDYFKLE